MIKTIRAVTIEKAKKDCSRIGRDLMLTPHAIDRLNVRSVNQDQTFLFFYKCINHLISNTAKLMGKRVKYKKDRETFVFAVDERHLTLITYYFHSGTDSQVVQDKILPGKCDVIYKL